MYFDTKNGLINAITEVSRGNLSDYNDFLEEL